MNEEIPAPPELEQAPHEAAFRFDLLSDEQILELNYTLTTVYFHDHGRNQFNRDDITLGEISRRLGDDLEQFSKTNPDRASLILGRVAYDPAASDADLRLAISLGRGLFEVQPDAAFHGLLATAYGNHYDDNGLAHEAVRAAHTTLANLSDAGQLTDEQLLELQQRKADWHDGRENQ